VVDIVHVGLRVDQQNQVTDDGDDILPRQDPYVRRDVQIQFLVDTETPHISQVVTLVRKEQLFDHVARSRLVGRLRVTQLAVDIDDGLFFGVARVFLQGIVYDGEIGAVLGLLMD